VTVVKELFTRMGFQVDFNKLNQFDRGVGSANRSVDALKRSVAQRMTMAINTTPLGKAVEVAQRLGRGISELRANVGQRLRLQIDTSSADAAKGKISSLVGNLKGLAAAYIGFQGVTRVGGFIAQTGMEFEKLSASLETVEGNSAKAATAFKKIEKFAAKTPYDLNQVTEAYIKLKSLGLEPSERALTAYGNTAGAMGKPLMQMIEAVADASTGEFERLKEFGIKTKKQGENVTFTFKGVQTTVKNNSENIQKYLLKIGEVDFAGGMDRQSKTIGGKISTLKDNFGALAREIWKGGLGQAAHQFVKWLSELTAKMQPVMQTMARELPHALQTIGKLLPFVAAGLAAMTFRMVGLKAMMVGGWILDAIKGMQALSFASGVASITTMAIPIAIGAAVAAVAYLAYQVYTFATTGKGLIGDLAAKFPEFGELANQVRDIFLEWQPQIMLTLETLKIMAIDGFIWMGTQAVNVLQYWIIPAIISMAETWRNWYAGFIIIRDGVMLAYENWKIGIGIIGDAWKSWGQNVTNTINLVKEVFVSFFNYLAEKFSWVTSAAGTVANAMSSIGNALGMGAGGGGGGAASAGVTGNLAATAINFVKSGQADAFAKQDQLGLFARGVACALTVKTIASKAGLKPEVLAKMSVSAPGTLQSLLSAGLVEKVQAGQQQAGDLAFGNYNRDGSFPGLGPMIPYHIGLVSGGGNVIDASNGHGREIGKGQRVVEHPLSQSAFANGQFYRFKANAFINQPEKTVQMPAASMGSSPVSNMMNSPVTQTINLSVGGSNSPASEIARQTGAAVKTQTQNALATVGRSVPQKVAPR
jgi:hypothetical protein